MLFTKINTVSSINIFVFDSVIFFSSTSISLLLSLLSLIVLNIETILGFFSIKSVISGAKVFFEFPARSYNKSTLASNFVDNLFIKSILGAERLFFSISFKYEGATPMIFANSRWPILFSILKWRI